ncbi:RNA polymerase sigma-70 factor (ECF subfamily) [Nocardiopsis sp. Huas11]|uniref:sigma-70 family RNA polymerase sigma factor n=1 Tax=Nocardiopsis sp. Huas11 TaxID=2183912 RepID=UPI000EB58DA9|nr:sigma-70 family RNA polymerase sigma factor [Nocardiopsis sp. Huas11]RKS09550.1 RNA polymerase sigma-70 factor (ECF subfamily) [Nocardiopsis sp. Huas11]
MDTGTDRTAVFHRERPRLLAVAFRVLGSDADAQDAVQEAWIRYARADLGDVRNVPAWLTTVVTRLCLDVLRRSREDPAEPAELRSEQADAEEGPEELALLAGELTEAFTVVLDELTPPQRVALVLHDVFGVPFDEVAHVLDTTPGSAKKLASRARGRVRRSTDASGADPTGADDARRVADAFLRAARQGDVDALVRLLDPGVIRTADPQALPPGAAQRVTGAPAVIRETRALRDNARRARTATIDGRPGIAVPSGEGLQAALVLHVEHGRIVHYDVVADPRRLALLHVEP